MNFEARLDTLGKKIEGRVMDIHRGVVDEVFASVVHGSEITGAPGQPEADGDLIRSWEKKFEDTPVSRISTSSIYAPWIEEGGTPGAKKQTRARVNRRTKRSRGGGPARGFTLRSARGGFHSVKLTLAAMSSIFEHVVRRVRSAA